MFLFLGSCEMTLRSEESIMIVQALLLLLQAEKFHLHFPLKPITLGLGLSLMLTGTIQSWRHLSSATFPQLELQLFSFANQIPPLNCQSIRRGKAQSAMVGNKSSTRRCSKRSNPVLLPAKLCSLMHWSSAFCASPEHLRLDFLFPSSRLQNKVMSQPGLKAFSTPLEPAPNFSDLCKKIKVFPGSKNHILYLNLACPTWPRFKVPVSATAIP